MSWQAIERYFIQMFPAFKGQYESSGINEVYTKTLSKFPIEALKKAIDKHAAQSHYAPRPSQLADTARLYTPTPKPQATRESREEEIRETRESWEEAARVIAEAGPGVAKAHRKTILETDWRVSHLKDKPILSKAWMAILYPRIKNNINPHQPPEGIPPCPSPKNSGKNGKTSSGQVMSPPSSDSARSKHP